MAIIRDWFICSWIWQDAKPYCPPFILPTNHGKDSMKKKPKLPKRRCNRCRKMFRPKGEGNRRCSVCELAVQKLSKMHEQTPVDTGNY